MATFISAYRLSAEIRKPRSQREQSIPSELAPLILPVVAISYRSGCAGKRSEGAFSCCEVSAQTVWNAQIVGESA